MLGLIVARSKNNVIGRNGKTPWKIKGELSQLRDLTMGNVIIMGRRSYEEIGHPLKGRTNIVVSNTKEFTGEDLITVHSLTEALKLAGDRDAFVTGGVRMFEEAIPMVDKMYITEIDLTVEDGDAFFPAIDPEDFDLTVGETAGDEIRYTRTCYTRKKRGKEKFHP